MGSLAHLVSHPRARRWVLLAVLWAVLAALALGNGHSRAASIDTKSRLHPMLQAGMQAEPSKKVSVIVSKKDKKTRSADVAKVVPASVDAEFPAIGAFQISINQNQLSKLAADSRVRFVVPNLPVKSTAIADPTGTNYENAIGVPAIWNSTSAPATGKGVGVAVLDTGININHSAFAFDKSNVIEVNTNKKALGPGDGHGHGTHVAGTIKGKDAQGRYTGVAPDVKLVSVKIADDTGAANEGDLITGLQWVFDNRTAHNIKVVNISVSSAVAMRYDQSPVNAYVEQLWFAGVTVVVSSGNRGNAADAMWYAPGNDPYVITVGALDHKETVSTSDDSLGTFSSRGLTQAGHAKPEVVAPGRKIIAPLSSSSSTLALTYPERIIDGEFIRLTGTSMSSPVVAGVVALLLERFPSLTPNQVKWLIMQTANAYPGQVGTAGVIDPAEMMSRAAAGGAGSANAGLTPAAGIDPVSGVVSTTTTYWDQTYWDQTYWDQTYWDQTYWDASCDLD